MTGISKSDRDNCVKGNPLLKAALEYASRGWLVFPVHSIANGICTCGKKDCEHPGKHPRTKHGFKDASTNPQLIEKWWTHWPNANIAGRTGRESGYWVLDKDGPKGEESLAALTAKNGPLPDGLKVITGRPDGGCHYYFRYSGKCVIPNSQSKIGEKLDVKGDGGYVILPPSLHESGRNYEWELSSHLDDIPDAPQWLLDLVRGNTAKKSPNVPARHNRDFSLVLAGLPDGERDDSINRYVWSRLARGMSPDEIKVLVVEAARNCDPPFDEAEALKKVDRAIEKFPQRAGYDLEEARDRVKHLIAEPKDLHKKVFDPETIGALAVVKKEDPALWSEFKQGAKKRGLLRDVDKQIRKARLSIVSTDGVFPAPTLGTILIGLGITPPAGAEDLVLPSKYFFDEQGTAYLSHNEDGARRKEVAPSRLMIQEKSTDLATKQEWLKLAFTEGLQWKSITVPRGDAMIARRCMELSDRGYPVGSHSASEVAKFLFEFESANQEGIPCNKISSALGWIHDGKDENSFLWGDEQLRSEGCVEVISFRGEDVGDNQIAGSFSQRGGLTTWIKMTEQLALFPHARLAFYASAAAPLLKILDAPSLGVDFTCKTSMGKTTLLRAAASIWGNPDETAHEPLVHTWDCTPVAVERICGVANDLPLFLDDSKRAKKTEHISPLLYSIISGHGRVRGSRQGLRQTRTWRTVVGFRTEWSEKG